MAATHEAPVAHAPHERTARAARKCHPCGTGPSILGRRCGMEWCHPAKARPSAWPPAVLFLLYGVFFRLFLTTDPQ